MEQNCLPGYSVNVMAASLASAIAQGLTVDEINVLSCFFTVLGDSLASVAAVKGLCSNPPQPPEDVILDR